MKPLPTPEEFLKERFLTSLSKEQIAKSFRQELKWLNEYSMLLRQHKEHEILKIVSKVNFLISACISDDKNAIDEFVCMYGKIDGDGVSFDFEKILNQHFE
jgi:hypothetical protein